MSGESGSGGPGRPKSAGPRHVFKTGAAGCGGKAGPTSAKNSGQPLPCPFCDRIFKQDGRLKEHLKNQHEGASVEQAAAELVGNGGASGSGSAGNQTPSYSVKTPKTQLHEWCQKNKKLTPKYKHVEVDGGFHCRVILPDGKKSEDDVIVWYKEAPAPASLEAQHRAAVVALHHVMGDRRLDRILPEQYRQQWRNLDAAAERRKAFLKANPPKPKQHRKPSPKEIQSVFMSEGNRRIVEDLLRNDESGGNPAKTNMELSVNPGDLRSSPTDNSVTAMQVTDHDTRWFGQTAEPSVRESGWASEQGTSVSGLQREKGVGGFHGNEQPDVSLRSLRLQLEKMGFSDDYVKQAVDRTNNVSQALDWLVLNVPEHKLPAKFAPESSKASVQVLVRESQFVKEPLGACSLAVMSLQQFGYSEGKCQTALVLAHGDKDVALYHLFQSLTEDECPQANRGSFAAACAELAAAIAEEKLALLSIFADKVVELSESCLTFQLASVDMEVRFPPGCMYPHEIPVIGFRSLSLSSDYLLDVTKNVAKHAQQFLGSPMIYDLVMYAQEVTDLSLLASEACSPRVQDAMKASISDVPRKSVKGCLDNLQHLEREKSPLIDLNLEKVPLHGNPVTGHRDVFLVEASGVQTRSTHSKCQQELLSRLESQRLKRRWENLQGSSKHAKMQETRSKLPAFSKRSNLLSTIESCRVTIICGETGCGKSTQVPQYILEEYIEKGEGGTCNIICTQPRRLSAIGLADRVADERSEATGETVGYSVRLEHCRSERTRLLFCTTGILLRRLLSDPRLDGVTHVIVDEVHERTLESDLLLLLLRELIGRDNNSLHVILMSATVEASLYSEYFAPAAGYCPKIVRIPGFTFPVRELYLEDAYELTAYRVGRNSRYALKKKKDHVPAQVTDLPQPSSKDMESWESRFNDHEAEAPAHLDHNLDHYSEGTRQSLSLVDENIINLELIEALIVAIFQQDKKLETLGSLTGVKDDGADGAAIVGHGQAGAVLVFLPGMYEIKKLQSRLQRSNQLASCGYDLWIQALHGSLSGAEQRRVFLRPPANVRKVVLATNIAETSITIDDVVYVVDTGHHKEMRYDHIRGLSCLEDAWISKANAKQRRGRAGRVQPGCCIRLFSRQQFERFDEHQLPEVHRISLEGLCLKVKSLLTGKIEDTVNKMISPPRSEAISTALKSLQELNALDSEEILTPLGQHLARMPVDARVAKMLLFGCILRCLDPVLTIAASLSGRSPFLSPMDKRDEASMARRRLADNSKSDHMAVVAAYNGWVTAKQEGWAAEMDFCSANYVSRESLISIEASRVDYERILEDLGFISSRKSRYPLEVGRESAASDVHANSKHVRVVKACICAGFYPHVVRVHHPEKTYVQTEGGAVVKTAAAQELCFYTRIDGRVFLHPSSVLFPVGYFESPWLVFSEKVKTSKVFVRECSMVSAYGFLLFGGEIRVQHEKQTLAVDDWLQFEAPARIAVLIKELRLKVDSLLLQKIQIPSLEVGTSPVVTAIIRLLTTDGF